MTLVERPPPRMRMKRNARYKSQKTERLPMDGSFREGWAFSHDTAKKTHYFIPSTLGTLVSLCHVRKQYPVWVIPEEDEKHRCGQCVRFLERRRKAAKIRLEREFRREVDDRVAAFLADPTLGPRLYGCPVCASVYEGLAPNLFPCSDGGHEPATVVELAKKDTWTRDKRISDAL